MTKANRLKREDMTSEQLECYDLLCDLVGGDHRVRGGVVSSGPLGIQWRTHNTLSTTDFDELTRLVLLCHQRCIRAEIAPSMACISLFLHKRDPNETLIARTHPSLDDLIRMANAKREEVK